MKPKIDEGDFNEVLDKSIAESKHDSYLKTVKENYTTYAKSNLIVGDFK